MDQRARQQPSAVGQQLRAWRARRHLPQLELSIRANVAARHLSFVETGRSQPGRDFILRIADELDIPLRERNALLMLAGFSPMLEATLFSDAAFDSIRGIVDLTLERHKPFPAYLVDRHWNVIRSNGAVPELYEGVDATLMSEPNVIRLVLHPKGLAPRLQNYAVSRNHYVNLLRHQFDMTADPQLGALLRETLAYPSVNAAADMTVDGPAVPLIVRTRLGTLSFIGATTVFRSPADVTLQEIALEVMHPADTFTENVIR